MKARIVEVSGKTVDEAVARALAQIGLTRDQVAVDVVSEGRGGFLGIGSEEAVVRVTAKQSAGSSSTASRTEGTGGSSRRRGRRGGRGRGRGRGRGGAGGEGEGEGQGQGQGSSDEPRYARTLGISPRMGGGVVAPIEAVVRVVGEEVALRLRVRSVFRASLQSPQCLPKNGRTRSILRDGRSVTYWTCWA